MPDRPGKLSYRPIEGAPDLARSRPNCDHCYYKREGSCRALCRDIRDLMRNERSGVGRKEHTNELNLEGRKKVATLSPRPIYSKFLEVDWVFSPRQLQVLTLLNAGKTRFEVCQALGISPPALSAIVKRAEDKYLQFDAKMRAMVMWELKKLTSGQVDDDL